MFGKNKMTCELRHVVKDSEIQDIFNMRYEVFISGMGRPDPGGSALTDVFDPKAIHVLASVDATPAGSIRFLPDAPQLYTLAGKEMEAFFKKGARLLEINCFVVRQQFRKSKVGPMIIRHNYLYPFKTGYDHIIAAAPASHTRLLTYYKRLGWRPFGRGHFSYDFSEPCDWILLQVPIRSPLVMLRFWLLLPLLFALKRGK